MDDHASPQLQELQALRRAYAEMNAERARYAVMFDRAPVAYLALTDEGVIVEANLAAATLFGIPDRSLAGRSIASLVHEDDLGLYADRLAQLPPDGEPVACELRVVRPDGSRVWTRVTASAAGAGAGGSRVALIEIPGRLDSRGLGHDGARAEGGGPADERLRELTDRLQLATASVRAGVWDFNLETSTLHWDERMLEIYGIARGTFTSRVEDWERSVHPDDRDSAIETMRTALHGEREYDTEFRVRRADGTVAYVKANGLVLRDAAGLAVRMIGINTDITGPKLAQEQLRAERKRLFDLLDALPALVYLQAPDYSVRFANSYYRRRFGDPEGRTCYQNLWGRSEPCTVCPTFRVFDARAPQEWEWTEAPDGRTYQILDYPFVDADGELMVLELGIDITDRKRADEALRRSEERLREVLENSLDAPYKRNLRTDTYEYMSPVITRLSGYTPAELTDASLGTMVERMHPDDRDPLTRSISQALASGVGGPHRVEYRFHRKDGHYRWFRDQFIVVGDSSGEAAALIGSVADITERKQVEAEKAQLEGQLLQSQKLESVGRLAGGVAHDFNNMLGVILGHAELAMNRLGPRHEIRDDLEEIRDAVERSADLTQQLLAFARRQTVSPKVLDLNQTVSDVLKMLRRLLREGIALNWHPGDALWPLKLDPSQVGQVLANLLINARDAIGTLGHITVETENVTVGHEDSAAHAGLPPGRYVRLAVSDDGRGMDQETASQVFEPFFTTKGLGQGTGLGLATVYGIVKQNAGFIDVFSEPGTGSRFTIHLPRYEGAAEKPAAAARKTELRGHETVLLVEDEPAVLRITRQLVESLGYTVLPAAAPSEAIRLAEHHPGTIDLLLTDVVMPGMNGRDLATTLLALRPDLKVLFTSGYTADVIAHHGVLDEGRMFVAKPYTADTLAAKIREALEAGDA
jgi:two-component system, cell cycle sensor histidine kinase and response regulator CckA